MAVTRRRLQPGGVAFGLAAFAALTLLGALAAGWLDAGTPTLADVLRELRATVAAPVLALVVLDYALGGLRLHLWMRRLAPGIRYTISLRAYLVTLFAGPVSPMSAASGPTQIATLAHYGINPGPALAALLLNYFGILAALLIVGASGALYLLHGSALVSRVGLAERSLLAAAMTIPLLLIATLTTARPAQILAASLERAGRRGLGRVGAALVTASRRLQRAVSEYRTALASVRGEWKAAFIGSFSISGLMLLERAAVAFLLARGLGFEGGYGELAARHALQQLLLYFSPTPGGSGLAEASVPILFGGVLPAGAAARYALLWRGVTSYLGIAVGAVTLALVFGPAGARRASRVGCAAKQGAQLA